MAADLTKYTPDSTMTKRIENDFTYHKLSPDQETRCEILRDNGEKLSTLVATYTKPSREQSLALTAIDEAITWAIKAIARNEQPQEDE